METADSGGHVGIVLVLLDANRLRSIIFHSLRPPFHLVYYRSTLLPSHMSVYIPIMFPRRAVANLARNARCFASSASHHADFTHAVIGAGAVGLAVARRLQQIDGAQVVLIEKHGMVGSETSSRNSEAMSTLALYDYVLISARSFMLGYITVTIRLKRSYVCKARK